MSDRTDKARVALDLIKDLLDEVCDPEKPNEAMPLWALEKFSRLRDIAQTQAQIASAEALEAIASQFTRWTINNGA